MAAEYLIIFPSALPSLLRTSLSLDRSACIWGGGGWRGEGDDGEGEGEMGGWGGGGGGS